MSSPSESSPPLLRLGTRGSLLARTQSEWTADQLRRRHPGLRVDLIVISTTGDRITDRPLADAGGKGLFTKELELALLAGEIDFAVHSLKDVPVTMPLVDQSDLTLAAIPPREDARDVLVSHMGKTLADLPPRTKIGTGSLRRRCQILAARPDAVVEPLRGNVDTRLRKLDHGECGAIVLALAGLKRLGKFDPQYMTPIDPQILLPAAGQGALALQCRRSDAETARLLSAIDDPTTRHAVFIERAVVQGLNGDCYSPIAALADINDVRLSLKARLGLPNGHVKSANIETSLTDWKSAVSAACRALLGGENWA